MVRSRPSIERIVGGERIQIRSPFCFWGPCVPRGFSLLELVGVLLIAAVVGAVAIPRLWGSRFEEAAFADETLAALRFAHRSAVTMQRTVCVAFTATTATFTYDSTYGGSTCPGTGLPPPGGGAGPYVVTARGSASFSPLPSAFNFDRVGQPSAAQTITFSGGGRQVVIEAVTGYVH